MWPQLCATVCLTVIPSFSDITDVSTIGHSFKTDRSRTHLFHVAHYGDDIIGGELKLRKLPELIPFTIAATDEDKDLRLYRNGPRGLYICT